MKISLVIPAYNEESQIGACLDSVMKNGGERFYEIIVVDNVSTDRTAEIAASFPRVRVVRENKKGTGPARNAGFLASSGDLVAYMDSDCRLRKEWIDGIEKAFQNPELVLLSGPYRFYDATELINDFIHFFFWRWFPLGCAITGCTAIGGNMIMRRDALAKIGGFNTDIAFYGEDTDVADRISKWGRVDFDPSFYMPSSARRYRHDGVFVTVLTYTLNGFWWLFFQKPFSNEHNDVR